MPVSAKSIVNTEYKPSITVTTKLLNNSNNPNEGSAIRNRQSVIISVKDNGPGIPEKIREKIFQPFFTTKPTGEGTGLGLSMSYDIIKAHGGSFKVESKENEGSEFIIQLPLS
jgi:signal transduction histidine kinase